MKKLMTTLLVVLLGWTGLCFAEGVTVSGTVKHWTRGGTHDPSPNGWTDATVKLFSGETTGDPAGSADVKDVSPSDGGEYQYGVYSIENVTAGTYTLVFEGKAEGLEFTYTESITVGTDNLQKDFTANLKNPTLTVTVNQNNPQGWGSRVGIANASVVLKEKDATGDGTTQTTNDQGQASFTSFDMTKTYTVAVTANGFVAVSKEVTNDIALEITMEPQTLTLSGTVKLGETTLSKLPDGVTALLVKSGSNTTTIETLGEGGTYSVSNVLVGEVQLGLKAASGTFSSELGYVYLSNNYGIISPENATFTTTDNTDHTFTQNIVLSKIGARVSGTCNHDLSDGELTLTKEGETDPAYTCVTVYGDNKQFYFDGVKAGTYKVALKKDGYVVDGEIADITIGADLADVNLPVNIKAVDIELSFTGQLYYYDAQYNQVGIEGAEAKLYAATRGSSDWVIGEEVLATATSDNNGNYTLKYTGKIGSMYVVKVTHATMVPFQSATITANYATNSVSGSVQMLWVSGEITYNGDLTDGKVVLKISEYDKPEAKVEYKDGKYVYYLGKSSLPVAGTYDLSFEGRDDADYIAYTGQVTIATNGTPVTHNFTAAKDPNKGYMRIWAKYHNGDKDVVPTLPYSSALYKVTATGEEQLAYIPWDENGRAEYLAEKGTSYNLHFERSNAYMDSTYKNIAGFNGNEPNRVTLYLKGKELPLVKVSGTVTGATTGMGSDVKVSMVTPRDRKLISANITGGKYEFTEVPADGSRVPLFLTEADAKPAYNLADGVSIPYNYALTSSTNQVDVSDNDDHAVTWNIVVEKIASKVSGTVTGYAPGFQGGEVTLTKEGATEPDRTYGYSKVMPGGQYTFVGVPAGTYTVNFKIDGYEAAPATVTVTLEADATVPAVTLIGKDMTVKLSGNLSTTNPNTYETEYFDGAKIEIWGWAWDNVEGAVAEGHETEKLAETTLPASNSYGNIPEGVTFTAKMGQSVVIKITHPSIKPLSQRIAIESSTLTIGASNLQYEWAGSAITLPKMKDFNAAWNAAHDSLLLSWAWPEELKNTEEYQISRVSIARKLATESGAGTVLRHWEPTAPATFFAYEALPVSFKDTVKEDIEYAYIFEIAYEKPIAKRITTEPYIADMQVKEYTVTLVANNKAWGSVEGAGKFKAGEEIEIKAIANEGYKFVAWTEGEKEVSTEANYKFKVEKDRTLTAVFEEATTYYTVTLQANNAEWGKVEGGDKYAAGANATIKATANKGYKFVAWKEGETEVSKEAVYTFKVEKDITLTAVFEKDVANEELEAACWTVYAENGTLVIKGLNGDRYSVYDLNGRLSGQALCTGAEIRMDVAPNKLYIVRRISAAGLFGAKKIVVR